MLKRTITAVCAIIIFIPICWFSDTFIYPAAMSFLSLASAYEMLGCVGMRRSPAVAIPSYLFGIILPILPMLTDESTVPLASAGCVIYLICIFTATIFSRGKLDYAVSASTFTGVFYTAVSFTCIVLLREVSDYFYLLVFIGAWTSDTFAYLCGRLFGKHKLIPEVSPKKTVEGSIGGMIFAGAAFVIYAVIITSFFDTSANPNYILLAVSGVVVSGISQIGDLAASVIKRRFDIKDYGWIFPGHGGVLDRFDSVLLTAPVLYIISQIPAFAEFLI